jgi:mono/diheme cytochrome c family protein
VIKGGGIMPAFKGILTDAQINAVAKYVADNAGK